MKESANGWLFSFKNLDEYSGGKKVAYTIDEEMIDGYTTKIDGYTITNTYTPEIVDIKGIKTWDDGNNKEGLRPKSITVRLLADGVEADKKVVSEADSWTYQFMGLPKYKAGKLISYTITEELVPWYTSTVTGSNITNTYTNETTTIPVTKTWDDPSAKHRPSTITVRLYADGTEVAAQQITEKTGWKHTFEGVPKYANGKLIVYTIREDAVKNYTASIQGFTIKNTYNKTPDPVSSSTPTSKGATSTSVPQTGDTLSASGYIALLVLSLVGIGTFAFVKFRKKRS